MRAYTLAHVRDEVLLRDLAALVILERATTAELLAHIAEVDARQLYLPAAYPSMFGYCVGELHLSEDAAYKRIQAARAARSYPVLFEALADGRLHLAAVCLLAPHLTPGNVEALVEAATHRRKSEIEVWLANWLAGAQASPPGDFDLRLAPGQVTTPADQLAPGQVATPSDGPALPGELASGSNFQLAPGQVATPVSRGVALHLKVSEKTHAKLCYAQALLGHAVPSGDVAEVLDRALDALIGQLEKRKFAAAAEPQAPVSRPTVPGPTPPRPTAPGRRTEPGQVHEALPTHDERAMSDRTRRLLPAYVRRAVWKRDQGRCTFRSDAGRQCGSRTRLEFDHVEPVARGGRATVEGLRLRCRPHNQYEAERAFGSEFMRGKRERARQAKRERTGRAKRERTGQAKRERISQATGVWLGAPP